MEIHEEFIERSMKTLTFYVNCRQWSGLTNRKIIDWIENFPEDIEIKYFAYKLLEQLVYYSEHDMKLMLHEGVFNRVLLKEILNNQLSNDFSLQQNVLEFQLRKELSETIFVPLLNQDAPFESGNQIVRILTHQLKVPTEQVTFATKINDSYQTYKRLIIVDDCIGSGDQCRNFWENTILENGELLRDWCKKNNVEAYYVVLVGYEKNITLLAQEYDDLKICCVELLKEEHRIFSEDSFYWDDKDELNRAREIFSDIAKEFNIDLFGYDGLDFAVIMHLNIPDWSLPLFWRSADEWKILMERKNSYG